VKKRKSRGGPRALAIRVIDRAMENWEKRGKASAGVEGKKRAETARGKENAGVKMGGFFSLTEEGVRMGRGAVKNSR